MALSQRGQAWASMSGDLLIWKVLKDLWDPQHNQNGFVSLGVAENALMHDTMTKYIDANIRLPPNGLTYGNGGAGSKALQKAMARFLTRKLRPVVDIEATHVCITNGVSCGIEHLSTILADKGDVFLLGQPHYGAFIADIELRPGAQVAQVPFGDVDPLSLEAISAYERTIASCKAKHQKVAGLMLCNPHNPLGRCYSREFLVQLMKLCQTHQIHLISDEVYALSVFRTSSSAGDEVEPFTSLASIPTDNLINPALTHILYGLSKDFGANGLRLGCIVSQHNPDLHKALVPVAIYSYASSLTESIATRMLSDDEFVDSYIDENCRRLNRNYELVKAWAESHGIEYAKGVNAGFFLWVNLGQAYCRAVHEGKMTANNTHGRQLGLRRAPGGSVQNPHPASAPQQDQEKEDDVNVLTNEALLGSKVFLAAGATFGSEKSGWFRIVFSQNKRILEEGLRRIEKALKLGGGGKARL